jgi:hypothetical protein
MKWKLSDHNNFAKNALRQTFFLNWDFPNPTLERGSVGAGVRVPAGRLPYGAPSQLTSGQFP